MTQYIQSPSWRYNRRVRLYLYDVYAVGCIISLYRKMPHFSVSW
jgi:hypothetical protein